MTSGSGAQGAGERGQHLGHEARHDHERQAGSAGRGQRGGALLLEDRDLLLGRDGVVRADLGAEAVLERGDDATAVGVVLGVGGRDHQQVQRQAQRVAAHLHVALLHHVQQRDLDALGQVGELVDRDDPAVVARDEAVVDRELVGQMAPLGDLDGIDVADQVGHRDVGRRELLGVAVLAADPLHGGGIAVRRHEGARERRERVVGVVVDLAARRPPGSRRRAAPRARAGSATWPARARPAG